MTSSQIETIATERLVTVDEVREACATHGLTLETLLDRFSLSIAQRYLDGDASYEHCDTVMNNLNNVLLFGTDGRVSSDIAWDVFLAFDAGEYHHSSDNKKVDPEEKYTRPFIIEILDKSKNTA